MQTVSPLPTSKKRHLITLILTVLGMVLFFFGGSKAISQNDDKEYVEGKPWLQPADLSSLAPGRYSGLGAADSLLSPVPAPDSPVTGTTDTPKDSRTEIVGHGKDRPSESRKSPDRAKKPAKE